jgi:hypothetical protein
MMKLLRTTVPAALLLALVLVCAADSRAQVCGGGFARIIVTDKDGKTIPDVTIELVAEMPDEEFSRYSKLWNLWNHTDTKELCTQEAEEIAKQWNQVRRINDLCGNPLKQTANSTRIENRVGTASTPDFGFCTSEGLMGRLYLLKITAPGYTTGYYAGYFLGGCKRTHKFVLSKSEK